MPSSSMLISQPVSATMPLMFLPPGPMSRPIFSGLIFSVSMRGRVLAELGARRGERARSSLRAPSCARRARGRWPRHDLVTDAGELEVELEAGDALRRCRRA